MGLADFIETNMEPILAEWVEFAASCGPARTMDLAGLRDHAAEMLAVIAADLRTSQTPAQQIAKSRGNAPSHTGPDTPAEVHGAGRAVSGFSLKEMIAEYRSLRASVLRLWTQEKGGLARADIDDLMRFNEAIDQALAESLTRYTEDLDQSREMFLAILGHDLRLPMGAIILSTQAMIETGELEERGLGLASGILRSSTRMTRMVDDLLDFTRSRLGPGIPILPMTSDMGAIARAAVEEVTAARPASQLMLETSGDLQGEWDPERIRQALGNLLDNAVQHGAAESRVRVRVDGTGDDMLLDIHNHGPAIATADIDGLFSPLKRLKPGATPPTAHTAHLGLGLYIAERIVVAHEGVIDVRSNEEEGTSFMVRLPRAIS